MFGVRKGVYIYIVSVPNFLGRTTNRGWKIAVMCMCVYVESALEVKICTASVLGIMVTCSCMWSVLIQQMSKWAFQVHGLFHSSVNRVEH